MLDKVVPPGLEPGTLRLLAVRSNQLSYRTSRKGLQPTCRDRSPVRRKSSHASWATPRAILNIVIHEDNHNANMNKGAVWKQLKHLC